MPDREETLRRLAEIEQLQVRLRAPLSQYTRFGIGGPADILIDTGRVDAFLAALHVAKASGFAYVVLGGGSNLIVSDEGYRGIVLRFTGERIEAKGTLVTAEAGAVLQDLIDFAIDRGLKGLETMAGIPGWVGAAVYGNAGAYGHSISERVSKVRFFDGVRVRTFDNLECEFSYRESIFKRYKEWILFSVDLAMESAEREELRQIADDIVRVRNEKFPPTMKCAGSIFKNLLLADLPDHVSARVPAEAVREGKVPAAYFLEKVGAKGMSRGDIHIASYHANLIYNAGAGSAGDLCALIEEVKGRVRDEFGLALEEEVQFVGFPPAEQPAGLATL